MTQTSPQPGGPSVGLDIEDESVMTKEPKTSAKDNPLVRALSRWENEGGRTDADWEKRAALVEEEEHILRMLGGGSCHALE